MRSAPVPVRSSDSPPQEKLARLRALLRTKPRDLLLLELILDSTLSLKGLLGLKAQDLRALDGEAGAAEDWLARLGPASRAAWGAYAAALQPRPEDYLFKSRKGSRPLSLSSASHLIHDWQEKINLPDLKSLRSLREELALARPVAAGPAGKSTGAESSPVLKPVAAPTLQEVVYDELLRAIVSGRIPPGERLITEKIAQQLHVSHMPVRQAMGRLQAAGFLASEARRRNVVIRLSAENLAEILKIRLALEAMAAEEACAKATAPDVKRLEALHRRYAQAKNDRDVEGFLQLNKEFHFSLYQLADAPILMQIIEGLWDKVSPYLHIMMREADPAEYSAEKSIHHHEAILEGMRQAKARMVADNLKADLLAGARVILSLFDRARK